MATSIDDLYLQNNNVIPFAVRQVSWPADFYVVVFSMTPFRAREYHRDGTVTLEQILTRESRLPQGPCGIPLRKGKWTNVYIKNPLWAEKFIIPQYNSGIWEVVDNVDVSNFEKRKIFELDSVLTWGKHMGMSIAEICVNDISYLQWCILDFSGDFCLSKKAIRYIKKEKLLLSKEAIKHNNQKLAWYLNEKEHNKTQEAEMTIPESQDSPF